MKTLDRSWEFHECKERVRSFVLPDTPIRHGGIFMPAGKCIDVKKAEAIGVLNVAPASSIILIEKVDHLFLEMEKNAPKLASIRCVHGKLERLKLTHRIDYAYLDLLGGLTIPISIWASRILSPNIMPGATVAITQIYASRGSKIIPEQETLLCKTDGSEIRKRYSMFNVHTQRVLMLIHRIFCLWDFDIEVDEQDNIPLYRDLSHYMNVFKLINFREPKCKFKPIEKCFDQSI